MNRREFVGASLAIPLVGLPATAVADRKPFDGAMHILSIGDHPAWEQRTYVAVVTENPDSMVRLEYSENGWGISVLDWCLPRPGVPSVARASLHVCFSESNDEFTVGGHLPQKPTMNTVGHYGDKSTKWLDKQVRFLFSTLTGPGFWLRVSRNKSALFNELDQKYPSLWPTSTLRVLRARVDKTTAEEPVWVSMGDSCVDTWRGRIGT